MESNAIWTESMKTRGKQDTRFAVCVIDSEPDLEKRKIYKVVPDEAAQKDGHLRVIDESARIVCIRQNSSLPLI
jgi:hypothetical protein